MQAELLLQGGYVGTGRCVGKIFTVIPRGEGYSIPIEQLELAGYESDGTITTTLYFLKHEVRILDD